MCTSSVLNSLTSSEPATLVCFDPATSMASSTTASPFDRSALERLFVDHERALFNVVCRWTWNREDAAEIVQEAFGRLWTMRARVDANRARPLVYRIALNLAASHRRWQRVRRFVGLRDAASVDTVEDDLLAKERHEALGRAMDRLPETLRRTLVLCELSELTYDEIAELEGTRPGTVGSRRHAALARLRPLLQDVDPPRIPY